MQGSSVVDIFCGVGGLTHGLILEGLNVVAGIDADKKCKYGFEQNNPGACFIHKKIEEVKAQEVIELFPNDHIKILVGCAPCQPFSTYKKKAGHEDGKWRLVLDFADLICAVRPEVVSMENVPDLIRFNKGKLFSEFVTRLEDAGYYINYDVVYCPDYGVPQKRHRLVFFASLYGEVSMASTTHAPEEYESVRKKIEHLEPLNAGETSARDPMHRARGLNVINLQRIRTSTPGGSWRDWPSELITPCHTRDTGKFYNNVYGRMEWDEPAPTITTQFFNFGAGRFGHPDQDRAITLREAALLQTFPENYKFVEPDKSYNLEDVGRFIGNAVPVRLGQIIGSCINFHLESNQPC